MGVKSNGSGPSSTVNTPISQMMELRSWQSQKMNQTVIGDECPNNILSKDLLRILEIDERQARVNLCTQIAENASTLIKKVIVGLARKQGA